MSAAAMTSFGQAFTDGNLIVNVIKPTAVATTGTAASVNLRQYTTAGTTVGTDLGTSISQSWSATSEGFISGIHHDFKFDPTNVDESFKHGLVFGGYSAAQGTPTVTTATGVTRQLGVLDYFSGNVSTFTLKDSLGTSDIYTGNNLRSISSYDAGNGALGFTTAGTSSSNNGVRTGVAGTTANANTTLVSGAVVTNWRVAETNGTTGFGTSASGAALGFNQITGSGFTNMFTETGASFYDFRMFQNGSTSIVYVADDRAAASGGGIQKWVNNGSGWLKQYTIATGLPSTQNIRTFATTSVDVSGNLTFYAVGAMTTASTVATAGNSTILSISDNLNSTTFSSSFTTVATAGAGETFKGIVLVPEPASFAILGIGVAGLIVRRRRQK